MWVGPKKTRKAVRAQRHPDEMFSYASLRNLVQHAAYGWKRGRTYLYIGASANVLRRISGHNVIGKAEPMQARDRIVIWYARTAHSAKKLAERLEARHRPKYSIQYAGLDERPCLGCKELFKPKRPWQKFCKDACRNLTSDYR